MKRLVILNIESSQLAGFTNKGVKVYARDILTNEEISVPMVKRPDSNQIALISDRVLKLFGDPRLKESWRNLLEWGAEIPQTKLKPTSNEIIRIKLDAITIDSDKTRYKSDAITLSQNGTVFHVFDFSNFKIEKLGRCSDSVSRRCLSKDVLDRCSFEVGETFPAISVNLKTKEIFKSEITITDAYTFESQMGITEDDIAKWGKAFAKTVCNSLNLEFCHDVTRPLHSIAGIAILSNQINLLDKIKSNQKIEKTLSFVFQRLQDFENATQKPSKKLFVKWTSINPIKAIQKQS